MAKTTKILMLFLIATLTTPAGVVAWTLPDTGQTQSYTDTFGEDSDYTINPKVHS